MRRRRNPVDYYASQGMPAFRIHLANGKSYVTSMAKGISLQDARKYFMGQYIEWIEGKPAVRVVSVDQIRESKNPRKRGVTRKMARAVLRARRTSGRRRLKHKLWRRLGHSVRGYKSKRGHFVRRAALMPKRRKKARR